MTQRLAVLLGTIALLLGAWALPAEAAKVAKPYLGLASSPVVQTTTTSTHLAVWVKFTCPFGEQYAIDGTFVQKNGARTVSNGVSNFQGSATGECTGREQVDGFDTINTTGFYGGTFIPLANGPATGTISMTTLIYAPCASDPTLTCAAPGGVSQQRSVRVVVNVV